MKFKPEEYIPVDYRSWVLGDSSREGINLKQLKLLKPKELHIWDESIKYQDKRDDPGQGEMVTYFTIKLLEYLPGKRKVAVPASILHDTGFYRGDKTAWKKIVNSGTDAEEINRRPHQNRGCLIAGRVLERVGYPESYHNEIADIIGDHDTRSLTTTESGNVVRAADLLWRVTIPCIQIYFPDLSAEESLRRIEKTSLNLAPPHNLRDIEKHIGKIEIVNSIMFKFPDEAVKMLKVDYGKELDWIIKFYN